MGQSDTLKCGICCLQKPKRPTSIKPLLQWEMIQGSGTYISPGKNYCNMLQTTSTSEISPRCMSPWIYNLGMIAGLGLETGGEAMTLSVVTLVRLLSTRP